MAQTVTVTFENQPEVIVTVKTGVTVEVTVEFESLPEVTVTLED